MYLKLALHQLQGGLDVILSSILNVLKKLLFQFSKPKAGNLCWCFSLLQEALIPDTPECRLRMRQLLINGLQTFPVPDSLFLLQTLPAAAGLAAKVKAKPLEPGYCLPCFQMNVSFLFVSRYLIA